MSNNKPLSDEMVKTLQELQKNAPPEWRTPTETVEGHPTERQIRLEDAVVRISIAPLQLQAIAILEDTIQSELDLALTKERARVNEVLEDLKNNTKAMSTTNEKAVEQTKGYLQALSDAQKRITDNT